MMLKNIYLIKNIAILPKQCYTELVIYKDFVKINRFLLLENYMSQ